MSYPDRTGSQNLRRVRLINLLSASTVLVFVVSFVIFGLLMARQVEESEQKDLEANTLALARLFDLSVADDLLLQRFDSIEATFRQAVSVGHIRELLLTDANGKVLEHIRRSPSGAAESARQQDQVTSNLTPGFTTQGLQQTYTHVMQRGGVLGHIQIVSSLEHVEANTHAIWRRVFIFVMLTLAVTMALLQLSVGKIAQTINRTNEFAKKLIPEKGVQLAEESRAIEVHELIDSLNAVSKALHDEHALALANESRKNAIMQASHDALISIDDKGSIVDFNLSAQTMFGYSEDEVRGKLLSSILIPPALRHAHESGMQNFRATRHSEIFNKRLQVQSIRRSGDMFPVELTVSPFQVNSSTYFLGSVRDITDQRKLEAEQKSLTTTLQTTLNEMQSRQAALDEHAIVYITNKEGSIIYANSKLVSISGFTAEELLGQSDRLLKSEAFIKEKYDALWAQLKAGVIWHGEIPNQTADKRIYWVETTIVPLKDDEGEIERYIAIGADISEHKDTLAQLDDYRQHLEELVGQHRKSQAQLVEAHKREVDVGHMIQKSLLFGDPPAPTSALAISAYSEPSKGIDGDFFEFFKFSRDIIDISIGDVMGKGVVAALVGAGVKQELNFSLAHLTNANPGHEIPNPADLVNELHSRVTNKLQRVESFITLLYLRIDLGRRTITYVNAGHTQSLLIQANGYKWLQGKDNLPLGVIENEHYHQTQRSFVSGDLLFLYSDGFSEARNRQGEEFGTEKIATWIDVLHKQHVPPPIMVQSLRHLVRSHELNEDPADDRTCIAIRLGPARNSVLTSYSTEMPWRLDGLDDMRQFVRRHAVNAGMDEEKSYRTTLVAFETASNIIRHAPNILPDATLHLSLELYQDDFFLIFNYLGEDFDPDVMNNEAPPDFSGSTQGGFGLFIVRKYTDEVSYSNPAEGICRIEIGIKLNKPSPYESAEDCQDA